jgi:hypothetical protein
VIIVDLTLATICFLNQCYPVLVGPDTPKGQYRLIQRYVQTPGYGGDLLKFKEDKDGFYAIHRIWLLNSSQHRLERIQSSNPKDRITITKGCINVMPEVYDRLVDCCSNDQLIIK